MKGKKLYPLLFLAVISLTGFAVIHAAAPADPQAPSSEQAATCEVAAAALAAQEVARKPKPEPEPLPLCLIEICKLRHNGQLLHCTVNVTDTCCEYKSNECTVVSSCPAGVGIYCEGSSPGGEPPNACNATCN
jgi:hypothetical protein